jgi:hypothetical protein
VVTVPPYAASGFRLQLHVHLIAKKQLSRARGLQPRPDSRAAPPRRASARKPVLFWILVEFEALCAALPEWWGPGTLD